MPETGTLTQNDVMNLLKEVIMFVNNDKEFINYAKTIVPSGKRIGEFYLKDIDFIIAIVFDADEGKFYVADVENIDHADVLIMANSNIIDLLIKGLSFEDALLYGMITPVGKYWLRDALVFKEMFKYYANRRDNPEVNKFINRYFNMRGGSNE